MGEFTGFGAYALLQEVGRFVYELRRLCKVDLSQPFEGCPGNVESWAIFVTVQGKVQRSDTLLKIAARARELGMRDVMDEDCLSQIDGSHKFLTDEREDPRNAFLPRRGTLPRLDNDLNERLVRALGNKRL